MGISFKVSKTGRRFNPKSQPHDAASLPVNEEEISDFAIAVSKKKTDAVSLSTRKPMGEARENRPIAKISDNEVSFTLNLFPDGYSIVKPVENESGNQISDVPKHLHPYDRASEALFSAIELGRLPGDVLDDIPCKYIDGTLVCEVRDYRKCFSEGLNVASGDSSPIINKVCLKMSLENIVKDVPVISNNGWTYGDLMEVESRILKATQPQLYLDPTPQFDRLSENPVPSKLNFDLRGMRRKRLRQIPEVAVATNTTHGKKVCLDRAPEGSRLGDAGSLAQQPAYDNLNSQNNVASPMLPLRNNSFGSDGSLLASPLASHQGKIIGVGSPRMTKDQRSGSLMSASVASPGGQEMMIPFGDNVAAPIHGKRENQDGQSSPQTNKRTRVTHTGGDGNVHNLGPQLDPIHGAEMHWKNTLMQQQSIGRGIQYGNNGMQKFSQQLFDGGLNQEGGPVPFTVGQQGLRYNLKEEPVETERSDKSEVARMNMGEPEVANMDSQQARLQQRIQQQFMRSGFPQSQWNNVGQPLDNNNSRNEQKRKLVQSPHVSAGGLPQSPLSSKSGEFSSGSIGHQFGAVVTSGLVSQKEKSAVTSVPSVAVGGNLSFPSGANDSMQRQNQAQAAAKRRSSSLPKTTAISGVGSPASVGNMSVQINASSPAGTQSFGDQTMLERFSKIEMVATRFQLNCKKNKVDEYPIRKPNAYSSQQLTSLLSSDSINENLKDETWEMPLSKSLVGGNMNVCKTRILNFIQTERVIQGNNVQFVTKAKTRMIMSEKPNDGAVAIHIGEIEDSEYLAAEDYLPTLPNTNIADLLAAQYSSLMASEGYRVEDYVQPKPVRMNPALAGQLNAPGIPSGGPTSEAQQFPEGVSMQQSGDIKPIINSNAQVNPSQNIQGPRMLPPGPASTQAAQMSQGLLPGVSVPSRPQQPDQQLPPMQQPPQHNQQQHNPQFQRSAMMLPGNSVQHLNNIAQNANMQLVPPHMTNKPSALQFQMYQQQQQQQQRKMMGLGTVGMGNLGNNMMGLGGLGNVMGMGGARGMGGSGISGPISSMNQNPMSLSSSNISNAIRSGTLSQAAQAAFMKLKMQQGRPPNMLGNPQLGIGGMPGGRQVHPGSSTGLSMLGPALNRANINQMQRTAMGPPKMMPGMNLYMNQQQQQQQQQQLQMQQQQQLQQQQLQQETSSPLQAVVSPPQVGSPSNMGIAHQMNQQQQQQQASPQQMGQRTPMSPQLSSGAIHPMSGANPEACPASPQLSSQTMGSVGSITNSPMDLHGVNKSNSVNNA